MKLLPQPHKLYGASVAHPVLQDIVTAIRIPVTGYIGKTDEIICILGVDRYYCSLSWSAIFGQST